MHTMATALYYVFSKPYVKKYPPLAVTAWAYLVAALCMGITAVWYNMVYGLNWILPADAYGPLVYWIVICSVCGYNAIAWSMTHLPATQVSSNLTTLSQEAASSSRLPHSYACSL